VPGFFVLGVLPFEFEVLQRSAAAITMMGAVPLEFVNLRIEQRVVFVGHEDAYRICTPA
jgi:hypothetical protein